jgi:hypothetical protein
MNAENRINTYVNSFPILCSTQGLSYPAFLL